MEQRTTQLTVNSRPTKDGGPVQAPSAAAESSPGIDRRAFMMRSAVIGAAAVMTGANWTPEARAQQAAKEAAEPKMGAALSPALDVVKKSKGPVMIVAD